MTLESHVLTALVDERIYPSLTLCRVLREQG